MQRVVVRSRNGNVALAVIGVIYTLGAIAALVMFAVDVWNAAAITDRALQIGLIAAAGGGVWFLLTGLQNLGVHISDRLPHFTHHTGR